MNKCQQKQKRVKTVSWRLQILKLWNIDFKVTIIAMIKKTKENAKIIGKSENKKKNRYLRAEKIE